MSRKSRELTQQTASVEFNDVKPKTVNQSKFIKAVTDNDVVICDGPAGTGKTLLSITLGCKWLIEGRMEHMLISRTLIGCGDIGTFPGTEAEKAEPYFYAQIEYIKQILGQQYRTYLQNGKIIFKPLEMLRGTTFQKTLMILDESQNASGKQIKMFLTRMGHYSKSIILGDVTQSDVDSSGFRFCLNFLNDLENCYINYFDYSDILRNTKIGHIIERFDKNSY